MNIIIGTILIVMAVLGIYECIKMFKKSNSLFEKATFVLFSVIYFIPVIIYYLDRFNIPTRLEYNNGINIDRWFNFLGSYLIGVISAVISAVISGVILIFVTRKQIDIDELKRREELNEQKRINNLPLLKIEFQGNQMSDLPSHIVVMDYGENNASGFCVLGFDIENIGLNVARNITCALKTTDDKFHCSDADEIHNRILKVGTKEWYGLMTIFDFGKNLQKNIIVTFYYYDLFNNKYAQDVELKINVEKNGKRNIEKGINYKVVSWKVESYPREKLLKE